MKAGLRGRPTEILAPDCLLEERGAGRARESCAAPALSSCDLRMPDGPETLTPRSACPTCACWSLYVPPAPRTPQSHLRLRRPPRDVGVMCHLAPHALACAYTFGPRVGAEPGRSSPSGFRLIGVPGGAQTSQLRSCRWAATALTMALATESLRTSRLSGTRDPAQRPAGRCS